MSRHGRHRYKRRHRMGILEALWNFLVLIFVIAIVLVVLNTILSDPTGYGSTIGNGIEGAVDFIVSIVQSALT
jgi:hypothetical protein